jgi:ActR/RegA family two-component response regulator
MSPADDADTVLIVDDEESVRKTFREWLESAGLGCRILTAEDAEAALVQVNRHTADLTILDWNLGAGNDGLRLLEDLYLFNPDVVAIMVTGFAHQATPLDAMRMGVRDYLDKNQDLDRDTFLAAVRRQLDRIRPAKRERRLHRSLVAFREAVEKILPLVQSAAVLNDPVPLPEAIRSLLQFLVRTTSARDGVLLVRSYDAKRQPPEIYRAYDAAGNPLRETLVPFGQSIAGTVASLQETYTMSPIEPSAAGGTVELQPFEKGRQSLLAAPMNVGPGIQVVLELFDRRLPDPASRSASASFSAEDQRLVAAATEFGAEILSKALAERQTHQLLFDAIDGALAAGDSVAESLTGTAAQRLERSPAPEVLEHLREGLSANAAAPVEAAETVRLAEAVRRLAVRHGPAAVDHCIQLVEKLHKLLDKVTGAGETRP